MHTHNIAHVRKLWFERDWDTLIRFLRPRFHVWSSPAVLRNPKLRSAVYGAVESQIRATIHVPTHPPTWLRAALQAWEKELKSSCSEEEHPEHRFPLPAPQQAGSPLSTDAKRFWGHLCID
jgi:hypothetical protein